MLSDFLFAWLIVLIIIVTIVATYIACIIVDNVFWHDDDDWSERGKKK